MRSPFETIKNACSTGGHLFAPTLGRRDKRSRGAGCVSSCMADNLCIFSSHAAPGSLWPGAAGPARTAAHVGACCWPRADEFALRCPTCAGEGLYGEDGCCFDCALAALRQQPSQHSVTSRASPPASSSASLPDADDADGSAAAAQRRACAFAAPACMPGPQQQQHNQQQTAFISPFATVRVSSLGSERLLPPSGGGASGAALAWRARSATAMDSQLVRLTSLECGPSC